MTPTAVQVLLDNAGIPGIGLLGCGEAQIPMVTDTEQCPNFAIFVPEDAVKWPYTSLHYSQGFVSYQK